MPIYISWFPVVEAIRSHSNMQLMALILGGTIGAISGSISGSIGG